MEVMDTLDWNIYSGSLDANWSALDELDTNLPHQILSLMDGLST